MSVKTAEHCELVLTKLQARVCDTLTLASLRQLEMIRLLPLFRSPVSYTRPRASTVASSCSRKVTELGSHSGSS
jgi:hypothetical protein